MPALAIDPGDRADLDALRDNGWLLLDPSRVARTPADYNEFVRGSKGELGVAKSGYVISRCGWFSDRSACYLASGRPVVAQDTGFAGAVPTGEGLLVFSTVEEAAVAIEDVRHDYARHARAAREIAAEHLDSDRVLARLLECL
jgi:glycosyltransferase involved in cell wall biosynthesis